MAVGGMMPLIVLLTVLVLGVHGQTDTERIATLEASVSDLSRALMMQSFHTEEHARADGNSGIRQIRVVKQGTVPYQTPSFVDLDVQAIHNHAHNIRTMGMGEVDVFLNGIEFRTRHNDFLLKKKHSTSATYGDTEDIDFPGVPTAVTNAGSTANQVTEMREWFKAWQEQDYSVRDYRDYFKPILCYMEGAWTYVDDPSDPVDEPFYSDRHQITATATSWLDLEEQVRYRSYAGSKDRFENLAYLPTTIRYVKDGIPVLAQWNYRILCHPLANDLPTSKLRPIVDMKSMIALGLTESDYEGDRAARFQIVPSQTDYDIVERTLLDELMEEIPGYDNYQGDIEDKVYGQTVVHFEQDINDDDVDLNAAYYHRYYRDLHVGAGRSRRRHRGFGDENLFVALTTQTDVAGLEDSTTTQRWSYAIPLELVYLTPLSEWNPLDIDYRGDAESTDGLLVFGTNGDLDGSTETLAFDGSNSKWFYRTPLEFFSQAQADLNDDDGDLDYVYAQDSNGDAHLVRASGHRVILPNIPTLGKIRQRYPIAPIHAEGSAEWKEMTAYMYDVYEKIEDIYANLAKK